MTTDAWGRPVSDDGLWFWDGTEWQSRFGSQISAGQGPYGAKPKGRPGSKWRKRRTLVQGLVALVIVGLLVLGGVQVLRAAWVLVGNNTGLAVHQSQIAPMEAEMQDLRSRWFGTPALWKPAPIANTDFLFFTVTGTTQNEIMSSFKTMDICKKYGGCAPDPAAPPGIKLGLEYFRPVGNYYYCYSPSTTTLVYREVIVLPTWSPPSDGSVKIAVVEAWNALVQVIYIHEAGHVAITKQDILALNNQAHHLPTCDALYAFWNRPNVFSKEAADQLAYHARLRADCQPEIGCFPPGWMGW